MQDDTMIKRHLVRQSATIREVADIINREKTGFALVVDSEGVLVGTVTDGDLRRAYLAGRNLNDPIPSIMCTRPITVPVGISHSDAALIAARHRIHHIPAVDGSGKPVDIVRLETVADNFPTAFKTAVIMAGGEGRRLRPYTEHVPKPMLPVQGKPILEHIVGAVKASGVERVFISVNYRAEVISEYFGDGSKFGIAIEYLHEKDKLGTAGSLSLLKDLPDQTILVTNGDVLTKMSYGSLFAFHKKHRGVMTVATTEYRVNVPFGTLQIANQFLLEIVEKPDVRFQCNAGVYALDPEVLQYIPANTFYDMTTLMTDLVHNGLPVGVFPVHEHWMDVGRKEDLAKATELDLSDDVFRASEIE